MEMSEEQKDKGPQPLHVSLVALPEAAVSTLSGIFDVMNAFSIVPAGGDTPKTPPFHVEIVGERQGPITLASHVPMVVQRPVADVERTDIVIVPSVVLGPDGWVKGRYPALVDWCRSMHENGALICSACSGIFLLAETDIFDGTDATVHFGYAQRFRDAFPQVRIHPEQVLVVAGQRDELITSGASMTWHDLVLYLIARHAGATAAQTVARFFALQWHQDGLAPYIVFEGRRDHGDQAIQTAQDWLAGHLSVTNTLEEMVKRSGLSERTFKRRFTQATGMSPIAYVQRLRIEEAKRRLERTKASIDDISWQVGYEEPAFFRRLFRRVTGLAPGNYRRRFQVPDYAQPPSRST